MNVPFGHKQPAVLCLWIPYADLLTVPTPETDWHIYQYVLENKPFMFNADYNEHLTLLTMTEEIEDIVIFPHDD